MSEHPNVARIKRGYAAFAQGDFATLNELFAEDLVWHEPGQHRLAGDYRGRESVYGLFGKLAEATEGTFQLDLREVYADDEHGIASATISAVRDGQRVEVTGSNVFHLRDGRVVEFWGVPSDQDEADKLIG